MRFIQTALVILLTVILSIPANGQGFSFFEHYSPEEYSSNHHQNWAAELNKNGYVTFGNGNGTMTFNGAEWNSVHIGESGRGISLYRSTEGLLYANGTRDFGVLTSDSLNRLAFSSIGNQFYDKSQSKPFIWKVYQYEDLIYYQHFEGIIKYNSNKKTLQNYSIGDGRLSNASFQMKDQIIVDAESGLWAFKDTVYTFIPNTEVFSGQRLFFGLELNTGTFLLGSINNTNTSSNLWLFDGVSITAFETEASEYLNENLLYDATRIDENTIAIATLYGGVVFMNDEGKILKVFNEQTGLQTNSVYDVFLDHEKTLWMGLAEGIQKLQTNTHIQNFSEWAGVKGSVADIATAGEQMLVYASPNIYRRSILEPEKIISFKEIDYKLSIGGLATFKNQIYVYGREGLLQINPDGSATKIYDEQIIEEIDDPKNDEKSSFITPDKILSYDGTSVEEELVEINQEIGFAVYFQNDIYVTLGTKTGGEGIAKLESESLASIPIEFDSTKIFRVIDLGTINGRLFAGVEGSGTNSGLYEYFPEKNVFRKSGHLENHPDFKNKQIFNFEQCSNGDIWFTANKKIFRVSEENGEWVAHDAPYQLVSKNTNYVMECVEEGIWLGSTNNLTFISNEDWEYETDFQTNITGIYIDRDSLIYGGYGEPKNPIILPYKDNELRFSYAAASYISPEDNTYQVKLEGFDEDWNAWTSETQKDYTNIPEGEYTFQVKSKNVYDVAGVMNSISFEILPPWYRTWWAYLLYTFIISGILYLVYKIRINQLLRVQRIRNNIASDLHDEVSATLSSISYFAQAIKSDSLKKDKTRFVDLIADSAGDAKEKISDIVWAINPEHDDWPAFLSKCRRFASDLLESKEMDYSLKIDEFIPGKLDMQFRQHLWLIYKEMITNAVRHSEAKTLNVILKNQEGVLKLIVQDDGEGMDIDKVKKGNGLVNIQKRADLINAEVSLKTSEGFGTRWVLNAPL